MIIVTGATGYIGSYLIEYLHNNGVDVLAVGRSLSGENYYKKKGIPFISLDITKKAEFSKLPKEDVTQVVHLAALIPERATAKTTGEDFLLINALGTYNVLEYCRNNNVKKVVYTTSHYEVSNVKTLPIGENVVDFINTGDHVLYIIAKIAGDQYMLHFNEEYGMQNILLRTTCIRGYSRYAAFHENVAIPKSHWEGFIQKALKGETIEVWGDCTTFLRDHLYVKDAVSCIVSAINSDKAIGRYNMASGVGITFKEEVEAIVKVFSPVNRRSQIVYRPEKINNINRSWVYDINKTQKDLSWAPKYTYENALKDIKQEMEKDGTIK